MMKKKALSSLAFVLAFSLMITSTAFATDVAYDSNISIQRLESIKENILDVNEYTVGMQHKEVILNVNLLRDQIAESFPAMSSHELGKSILLALGDSEEFVETLPEEKVLEALEYTSVVRIETYLHELSSGEMVEISKELFYSPNLTTTAPSIPDYEDTFGDIVLRSTAYQRSPSYGLPGRNYWSIRGEIEWVGFPNFQMNDLLVISSTGNIDNNYEHYAVGKWQHVTDFGYLYEADGGDGDFLTLSTPDMYGMGIEFPLGILQQNQTLVNKVYSYYGVSSQEDISCQVSYAHALIAWDPSFSVDLSGTVSFGGIGLQRQVFNGNSFTLYHD